jgi:hypothetical protein
MVQLRTKYDGPNRTDAQATTTVQTDITKDNVDQLQTRRARVLECQHVESALVKSYCSNQIRHLDKLHLHGTHRHTHRARATDIELPDLAAQKRRLQVRNMREIELPHRRVTECCAYDADPREVQLIDLELRELARQQSAIYEPDGTTHTVTKLAASEITAFEGQVAEIASLEQTVDEVRVPNGTPR